jgi:hypothetical protein
MKRSQHSREGTENNNEHLVRTAGVWAENRGKTLPIRLPHRIKARGRLVNGSFGRFMRRIVHPGARVYLAVDYALDRDSFGLRLESRNSEI